MSLSSEQSTAEPGHIAIESFGNLRDRIDHLADFVAAMSNPKRLEIMCILHDDETNVGTLASKVGLSQSALSQHLSKLRSRDIVQTRRDGQTIYYRMKSGLACDLLRVLDDSCRKGDRLS